MFGDLFEEDGDGFASTPGTGKAVKGRESEPPPPRGKAKLCGIKNQGGTCYLNSLIQTLLFTPEFREELFSLGPDELGSLADKDKPEAKVRVIPLELQRLFTHLLLVDEQTASTAALTDSFGWTNNEEMGQQDVQELNRILFSALESSLVGTSGSSLIHRLYHGELVNQITCKECGNISERQEDFLDLTVSVRGVSGLEEALWNMFVEEELFEGNNLYRCSKCDQLVRAAKSAKLRKLPPFLTISLLRFNFDFAKCERYKETGSYVFPLSFSLRAFCEQSDWPDSEYSYQLFSVIIHKGGCYGGHYHVYIKDLDRLGHWEAPEEDVKVKTKRREPKREDKSESSVDPEDPLSVLTAILSQESNCVLVDQLGQKLMNRTGTPWSKKYKKQFGSINKKQFIMQKPTILTNSDFDRIVEGVEFLQNHPEVFQLLSNGTRVALKAVVPSGAEPCLIDPPSSNVAAGSLENMEAEDSADGCHWFDLNDSTVTPISEKDIEKQFQGKESAYMLFYRKSTMKRPPEASGNPAYKVPSHLLEMVQEENAKVQQRRAEFDATSNSIEVRLHLAPHYHCQNGALHLTTAANDSVITVTFDRRKTVGDLRLAIYQMQDLWEGDMALTLAKNVPAGLHLYDTLTDDQMSLYSAGVCNGSDIFVWNGKEVGGEAVLTGAEWEPVLLTVLRPSAEELDCEDESGAGDADGSGLIRSMKGFAGGATLGTVLEALGPEKALLCQEHSKPGTAGGGASGWRVFPTQDMQRTLRELSLKDGDALLLVQPEELDSSIFSINGDIVTVTTPSDCRWLQVEFCPQSGMKEEEEMQEKRKSKISASGNMLLSEVKVKALEELNLQDEINGFECCLRQMDRSGKLLPPAHEHLSVRDAGVRLMTSLYLCPGPAPTVNQLFLYFSVGLVPSTGQELEIIAEESLTVRECLREMLRLARLEGDLWHLSRLDWCEEIGEPLMDENATLKEAKVAHGDTLVLVEGRLPPKGYLKLSVRMYVNMIDSSSIPELNQAAESPNEMLASEGPGAEMRFIGYVEISEEASLDDLKTQVMTLPALQEVCVPSPAFLRMWLLEGGKPARILRGKQQTLRKLKLGNGVEVCVERLMKEEDLRLKDLLLKVQMGVPGEKSYYPAEEFLWDAGCDGTPRGLYAALAPQYGLTPDNLLLAKHLPDKHTWIPICNWTQQVTKRKKKRKTECLQAAPYYLKDGDIIGVKNLLIDSNKEFSTVQDDIGQQRLKEEAANHKTRGHTAKGDCAQNTGHKKAGPTKNRKPEVSLSINVGVFR